jgi:mRNA interferase RelE/StbE
MNEPARYQIVIKKPALKVIAQLPRPLANRIRRAIDALATDPRPHGYKPLRGGDYSRIRVGSWRIVYRIKDDQLIVLVLTVSPRGRSLPQPVANQSGVS